ncbi:class I adenylate-forming enzyme family protein [Amycolatopsis sp. H20-H5]|uniref:class I adenylate-forming enzyme family protein n=1 Tax=Amycolatopsis sp. H20-H5 TaxID=3046309 RepID=UPI002DB579ED|nr:fatty acid--CoA ligase family protein [Amycolatopsis sp. H20-H5]MEC3976885.1 fatty acid--CoA ligase family protein [Amycolatopsis sp. H20-H5]
MLTALRQHRDRFPDATAIRAGTAAGWQDTTWAELYDATLATATFAKDVRGVVVTVLDGSAASIATVLGLIAAGVDVLPLEEKSSYLTDPGSPVHTLEVSTVVGPGEYAGFRSPPATEPDPGRESEILQVTSGSTGEPRIARQPLRNVLHGAHSYRRVFGIGEGDVVLATVPLAHSFGFIGGLGTALVSGATLVTLTRFNPRQVLGALADGVTMMLGTPLVYRLLSPLLRGEPPRPRIVLSSGGPLAPELATEAGARLGSPVRQIYGSTETGLIACHPASAQRWPEGSAGVPAPDVETRIGEGGRLFVRTPALFAGYAGGAPVTVDEDGFYDTGDLAVSVEGYLFLKGRKETFINVGGRKVNPRRIERVLSGHPGVREAFVFGADSAGAGAEQEIHAAVVLTPDTRVDELVAFCRAQHLMPYEVPHRLHPFTALPRTGMGKINRRQVIATATSKGSHG